MKNVVRAKYLYSKKFSNREYSICIDFFENAMAFANINDKHWSRRKHRRRWSKNVPWLSFNFFDECTYESMYYYFDCLDTLQYDKVARRWFMRQMRHCTDGLLLPNGMMDYDKIYERMYRNRRQSVNRYEYPFKDNKQPLPPNKLKVLLEMLPEAAYDAKIYQTYVNVGKKTKVKTTKDGRTLRYISRPEGFKLELIRRVLPDFYDTIKRERTLDNCEIDDIVITWMTPTDCDVYAVISDNDSAHYDLDWVEDRRFCDKD